VALADTAKLLASLELQDKMTPGVKSALGSLGLLEKKTSTMGQAVNRMGQGIAVGARNIALLGVAVAGAIATQVAAGVNILAKWQTLQAQTEAVIKSTGAVAGISATQVKAWSMSLEDANATAEESIQDAENVLLTFTNIRGAAFEPATQAIIDMSVALGTDLHGAAIQVGKALQDPVKGVTALRRVGVMLTADQTKQIADLVKHNKLYEAQAIILKELNTEFGGSGAAKAKTYTGQMFLLGDAVEHLQAALASALLPTLTRVAGQLREALSDPQTMAAVTEFGDSIASAFSPEAVKGAISFARSVVPAIVNGLRTAVGVGKQLFDVFSKLPDWMKQLLVGGFVVNKVTGGMLTGLAGIFAKGAIGGLRGGTPATPVFTKEVGLGAAGKGILPAAAGAGLAGALFGTAVIAVSIVGIAKEVADALGFREQRKQILEQTPGMTNAQALALQVQAHGGMESYDLRTRTGLIAAFQAEHTTYLDALAAATKALDAASPKENRNYSTVAAVVRATATKPGTVNAMNAVTYANMLADLYASSTAPSFRSMTTNIGYLKTEVTRLNKQGDVNAAKQVQKQIDTIQHLIDIRTAIDSMATGLTSAVLGSAAWQDYRKGERGDLGGDTLPIPAPPTTINPNYRGASGLFGITRGPTTFLAGEAGNEAVAIIRRPRTISAEAAKPIINIYATTHVSPRENARATATVIRSGGRMAGSGLSIA
jgi:Prophage tail length tape measure protein